MQVFGNILIGLASFITLLPLQLLLAESRRGRNDGGALWGAIFVFVPLWLLLTVALSTATARGGLDWLPMKRGGLHLLAILAGIAFLATSLFGFFGRVEQPSQLPVVSRLFLGWADLALPLVTIAFLLLTVNASLGSAVPALAYRLPFAILAGASLLHGVALLGEWAVRAQVAAVARAQNESDWYAKHEQEMVERVKTLDPEKDFAELLEASAWPNPEIREVALEKVRAHPQFREAIIRVLRSWRADAALTYLSAHDVPPEDKAALAQPVLDSFAELTRALVDDIDRSTHFYAEQFDRPVRLMLAAADKFADQNLDYASALRTYRRTMDTEATAKVQLNARTALDRRLTQQATGTPAR